MTESGTNHLPVFAFFDERDQLADIRQYLLSIGADASSLSQVAVSGEGDNNLAEVAQLVGHCHTIAESNECDVESVEQILNSLLSLIIALPIDSRAESVVNTFCSELTNASFDGVGWDSKAGAAIRVLSNLLFDASHSAGKEKWEYHIYMSLIELAGRANVVAALNLNPADTNEKFDRWQLSLDERRRFLRHLHAALLKGTNMEQTAQAMISLLDTYKTEPEAGEQMEEAWSCVRTALLEPTTFLFDHLITIKPVQLLCQRQAKLAELLNIFVSGDLKDYLQFSAANREFLSDELKANDAVLVDKMKILTLMSMAEKNQVIKFVNLAEELHLDPGEDLEDFVIAAVQTKAIQGRMDQLNEKLEVVSYKQRMFEKEQWSTLKTRLATLAANLSVAEGSLDTVAAAV